VAWLPDEESYLPGTAAYALSVIELPLENAVFAERLVSSTASTTNVSFAAADGVAVRFRLFVTNVAAMSSTFEMDCMVDSSAPSAGAAFIASGHPLSMPLLHGVQAYGQKATRDLFVCWHGFSDAETNITQYMLEMAPIKSWNDATAGAVRVTRSVEPSQAMLVANRSFPTFSYLPADVSGATLLCTEPGLLLRPAETYLVRVAAVNLAGDTSYWARATMATDETPPQFTAAPDYTPDLAPMVHTGASSRVRQTSDCCLRVSWPAAFDREVRVKHYKLCFQDNATDDGVDDLQCVDAGSATRVLVSSGPSCPCERPDNKTWLSVLAKLPLTNELNRTLIRFGVHAENELGLSSTTSFEVTVDTTAPLATPLQLVNATSGQLASPIATCAGQLSANLSFLPASSPLQVAWDTTFDPRFLGHWRVCLLTAGVPACTEQVEPNVSFGLLAAGVYTVQVHGVADTGAAGPVSQLEVVVDTTPPVLRCTALYL